MPKRLERVRQGRMLAGVCTGIAQYLNADVSVVRIITLLVGLFTGVGPFIYLAAWLVMPLQGVQTSQFTNLVGQAKQWNAPTSPQAKRPETFDLYRDQR